jgi:DNA-binding response OmpR family regulator
MDGPARVLVVDDDPIVVEVVSRYLQREGFAVETAGSGLTAVDQVIGSPPDLVVLDLVLPDIDGLEVCRRLRALSPVPVIMLTSKAGLADRVIGLDLGADDYLSKPFSPRELTSRVKAVLRRSPPNLSHGGAAVLVAGDLIVDVAAREARLAGAVVALAAREFELLTYLMRHPRQAFSREALLEAVWGWTYGDTSTVTVHVRRLREKIEADPAAPARLATVWGIGYRFEP